MTEHRFVADPAISISRGIPLVDEAGLGELTLSGFIRQVAERFVRREALTWRRLDGAAERWSYSELWEQSLTVAKALVAGGLDKGERVGVLMTNWPEFLAAVFGTALAGGVATPLSTFSKTTELAQLLAAAACPVLLFEKQVLKRDFPLAQTS